MKGFNLKTMITVTLMSVCTVMLFAASGGKGKKKSTAGTTTTNTKLNSLTKISLTKISLRSNYEFKGSKLFQTPTQKATTTFNNYTSIKKGNKTVVVASKHTLARPMLTLQTPPATRVNVSLARISLN